MGAQISAGHAGAGEKLSKKSQVRCVPSERVFGLARLVVFEDHRGRGLVGCLPGLLELGFRLDQIKRHGLSISDSDNLKVSEFIL